MRALRWKKIDYATSQVAWRAVRLIPFDQLFGRTYLPSRAKRECQHFGLASGPFSAAHAFAAFLFTLFGPEAVQIFAHNSGSGRVRAHNAGRDAHKISLRAACRLAADVSRGWPCRAAAPADVPFRIIRPGTRGDRAKRLLAYASGGD